MILTPSSSYIRLTKRLTDRNPHSTHQGKHKNSKIKSKHSIAHIMHT